MGRPICATVSEELLSSTTDAATVGKRMDMFGEETGAAKTTSGERRRFPSFTVPESPAESPHMGSAPEAENQLTRIIIAEPGRMICQLLAEAFRRLPHQFLVVASAADSAELLAAVRTNQPEIAIVSANLEPGMLTGLAVLPQLRAAHPGIHSIILLDSPDRDLVIDSFRAGARGVVCREQPFEVLCKCIQAVRRGQIWASNKELGYILDAFVRVAPLRRINPKRSNLLTTREKEVARLVAEGHTNRGIALQLNLSEHTVRNYLFRIFDKLGVSNRVELTLCCVDQRDSVQTH